MTVFWPEILSTDDRFICVLDFKLIKQVEILWNVREK